MLKKLIYLSFIFGLTACGGGMSDMEACVKNSAQSLLDDFAKNGIEMDEAVQKAYEEAMSMSWEEIQKAEGWKMYIGICETLKAEEPEQFKKLVKGEF